MAYPLQKYFIDPDGISYINIGYKYSIGNFKDGVNGFWSPMISWIIAVLLLVIPFKVLAAKIAGIMIGAGVLFALKLCASQFSFQKKSEILLYLIAVPLLIFYSYYEVPVDFTLLLFILPYLYFLFHPHFFESIKYPVLAGILGCFCYFSKQYAFPFFILHFFIIIVVRLWIEKKIKSNWHFLLIGYFAFLLTASPWIYLISNKYQTGIIYGTTGKINFSQALNNEVKNINDKQGYFLKNPNSTATDYTEDAFYIQGDYVSMFDSKQTLKNEIALCKKSCTDFLHQIIAMNYLILLVLLMSIIFIFQKNKLDSKLRSTFLYCILTIFIYPFGYLLIHSETRFFWIINLLILFLSIKIFEIIRAQNQLSNLSNKIIAVFILILFLANPFLLFAEECYHLKYVTQIAEKLKNEYHVSGNIYAEGGDYPDTQHIGLLLDAHTFIVNPNYYYTKNDVKSELLKNKVDYYFYWHWMPNQRDSLPSFYDFEEITKGKIYGLQVFKIKR